MNVDAVRQVLFKVDAECRMGLGDARADITSRLSSAGLPSDLVDLVTKAWPQTPGRGSLGPFDLATSAQLVTPELSAEVLDHGLLFFCTSGNGDRVAIELNLPGYPVLVFDHCNWHDGMADVRTIAAELSPSLNEFFERAANDPEMPRDYWNARNACDRR